MSLQKHKFETWLNLKFKTQRTCLIMFKVFQERLRTSTQISSGESANLHEDVHENLIKLTKHVSHFL